MQETWVQSLDGEDPLEKEMATHSSILAWEIPWTEEPSGQQSMVFQKSWSWLSNLKLSYFVLFLNKSFCPAFELIDFILYFLHYWTQ